ADELQKTAAAVDDQAGGNAHRQTRVGPREKIGLARARAGADHAQKELPDRISLLGSGEVQEGTSLQLGLLRARHLGGLTVDMENAESSRVDGEDRVVGGIDRAPVALLRFAQALQGSFEVVAH